MYVTFEAKGVVIFLLSFLDTLGEITCHVMRILKQFRGVVHVAKN